MPAYAAAWRWECPRCSQDSIDYTESDYLTKDDAEAALRRHKANCKEEAVRRE